MEHAGHEQANKNSEQVYEGQDIMNKSEADEDETESRLTKAVTLAIGQVTRPTQAVEALVQEVPEAEAQVPAHEDKVPAPEAPTVG